MIVRAWLPGHVAWLPAVGTCYVTAKLALAGVVGGMIVFSPTSFVRRVDPVVRATFARLVCAVLRVDRLT